MNPGHISVLLHEAIDGLAIKAGGIHVDGTLGSGGHVEEVVKRFGNTVRVIGIDMDADALARSKQRFEHLDAKIDFVQGNFRTIDAILDTLGISTVNSILLDIGLSSNQLEESGRGFSFQNNEPLQMTFGKDVQEGDTTAETVVNEWSEDTLETIIRGFGEERYAGRIARAIVEAREIDPIKTTHELTSIIASAVPMRYKKGKIHPATRTFQAIRIAVNQELQALEEGLQKGFERLAPNGRMAVISFHSLEDRIVKNYFKKLITEGTALGITKKPITPGEQELSHNRRSRSAKLRIIEKK
ncbi:MAG: mraW [Candidatus Paceibacter sp.]|jgi:16S rRNA (cytosine1402-N4)-methyltransferase|nr:mraW [Candidatus Paceibacter sp.]